MKKILLFSFFFLLGSISGFSQLINWQTGSGNPCAGTGNGTMNATSNAACITITDLCRGSGINSTNGGDFNSSGFDTSNGSCADAIADDDCLTWGFTIANGCSVAENSILEFQLDRSNTGPSNYCLDMDTGGGFSTISTGTISASTGCVSESIGPELIGPLTVTFRLCAWGASSGGGTMDIEDGIASCGGATDSGISLTEPGALPVSLTALDATTLDVEKAIELTWRTESEENNNYFSIERSENGADFFEIGKVNGAGTASQAQFYTFKDENLQTGLYYYRLKQIDYDGAFAYSDIVSAILRGEDDIFISPNPTENVITIQPQKELERDTEFDIINMQGQVVLSSILKKGESSLELNLSDFPTGVYYLRLLVDNQVRMKKILKQ